MCALSALNLAYNGSSTMEVALQHYHQALSAKSTASNPDELLHGGLFLRHFLLFIYDICLPKPHTSDSTDMWTIHLSHLLRISTLRYDRFGHEPHGYLLWVLCELDMYACLLGSGNCDFMSNVLQHNMLPPVDQQVPFEGDSSSGTHPANDISGFDEILVLNQAIVVQTAKLARIAQHFRNEAAQGSTIAPGTIATWQVNVTQLQTELNAIWLRSCPSSLATDDSRAGDKLPARVRYVFEHVSV